MALFILCSIRTKYNYKYRAKEAERRREMREREKRVVFADLILTTSPGRAFPWNGFAIAPLFIQVVGEPSKICREHAFCNTSL